MHERESSPARTLFWLIGILIVLFAALQLVRPPITNPPVTAEIQAPPEVKAILRNSCYNCHSNETRLPWFDQVVPAYWLVHHDVIEARKHLNFSEIGSQPAAKQKATLYEAVNFIQLGAMPLPSYRHVHPGSTITEAQLAVLRNYLDPPPVPATAPADIEAVDTQFAKWIEGGVPSVKVQESPNGLAFIPEYKTWRAISSTDRFDNNTMRVILGNDIAIRAIAENHINPWPDGTTFAKVTFHTQPDGTGFVQTGEFQQVELMVRDSQKFKSTAGWGWGRWIGMDLKPYGKNAAFTGECVSCHTPVAKNDFVFTMPIHSQAGGQQ